MDGLTGACFAEHTADPLSHSHSVPFSEATYLIHLGIWEKYLKSLAHILSIS
jgi:hypothetical protein